MVRRNPSDGLPTLDRAWQPIEEWNGFVKGDPVHVKGTSGCKWRFMYAYERNGVVEAITVYGGEQATKRMASAGAFRSFVPERVVKPAEPKRRGRPTEGE